MKNILALKNYKIKKLTVTGDCIEFDLERPKGSNGSFSEKRN